MLLELVSSQGAVGIMGWIKIHVRNQDGLGVSGFDMLPGTLFTVSTCANLVVK